MGLYPAFCCLAGRCPSTCCAGWEILVAPKDYERFLQMEPLWLRQDILSNIQERDGGYFFRNQENGRCAMLDEDGLCRIQKNAEEKVLCNTCRKYPRLLNQIDETLYLSMAASCPVVSNYLVSGKVSWLSSSERKNQAEQKLSSGSEGAKEVSSLVRKKVSAGNLSFIEDEWIFYQENQRIAKELFEQRPNTELLYACFEKMASSVLDIVLQYQKGLELLSFFQALEQDTFAMIEDFCKDTAFVWQKLVNNYMEYRILSRKMEFPGETEKECVRQAYGELFLLRTLAFCEYTEKGFVTEERWEELLRMVYRFCVHGKNVSKSFCRVLAHFFSQDYFWSYMLL